MVDIQDMTDDEFLIYQARRSAAYRYRAEGHDWFADRVELGLEDQCNLVRLAQFYLEPPPAPSPDFMRGWTEAIGATAQI